MSTAQPQFVFENLAPAPSALPGIHHVTLAGSHQGLRQLSVWQQVLEPGAATPPHRHDCEEVVLCTAGRGELRIDGQPSQAFGADTTLRLPPQVLHEIVNAGGEPLHMVAVFSETPVTAYLPDGEAIDLPWHT
jgi:quercetin dioxygenase-like cupin family protein